MSSCWGMFFRFTWGPALYDVMSLCRMFLSTSISFSLPLESCTTSYKEANVLTLFFWLTDFRSRCWSLSGGSHRRLSTKTHLRLSNVFCTKGRFLNHRYHRMLVDYVPRYVTAILTYAMLFERYNYAAFISRLSPSYHCVCTHRLHRPLSVSALLLSEKLWPFSYYTTKSSYWARILFWWYLLRLHSSFL